MKKNFLFFVFLFSSQVLAAEQKSQPDASLYNQKEVCEISETCKKLCDLKISDNLDKATPEQQKLIIKCAQDMMKKYNIMQQSTSEKASGL